MFLSPGSRAARPKGVRYGTRQLLPATQQAQARNSVYGAPFDSLAYNGMQVNGSMEVSQENGTTARTTDGYIVDQWHVDHAGTMTYSAAQVADAPPGLTNSIKITITGAEASLSAGDYLAVNQPIEGFRTSRLDFGTANAQPISVSFWTKIHRIGLYSGAVVNGTNAFSYPFTFTQYVADTWEFKSFTAIGAPSGTWVGNTNGVGMRIYFAMASGTTFQGTPNGWSAANLIAATGTTNGVAATSDTFQLTGVIVLPGIEPPSAGRSPFIMRSEDLEIIDCYRYYYKVSTTATATLFTASAYNSALLTGGVVWFPVVMRTAPTFTINNSSFLSVLAISGGTTPSSNVTLSQSLPSNADLRVNFASGLTAGDAYNVLGTASSTPANLGFDSRY